MDKSDLRERIEQTVQATRNNYETRSKLLKKLLKEAEEVGDAYAVGRVSLLLAACYFTLGQRNSIFGYALKAVDIFKKLGKRNLLASSYNVLGISYLAQENYYRAIECYNCALKAIRGLKNPMIRSDVILSNIAESYYHMGEYRKSCGLLIKCVKVIRTKHPEDHTSAVIYSINLSENYECLGEFEKAREILDSAWSDVEQLELDVLSWNYYIRQCCIMYKMGELAEGMKYADMAINAVKSGYDSFEFHHDYEEIAIQQVAVGDLERAQCFADILTDYAEKNGHTIDLILSKRVQARICLAQGEGKRALMLYRDLSGLYEKRIAEQHEMQYESQKSAEASSREIGKLLQRIRLNEEKAERDSLTGLMNRSALVSVTNEFIQNAKEKGRRLGAIFMDIDYFKEYNDTYGHAAGDEAIKTIANICLGEVNPSVKFFRYGGDEYFGIVLGYKDEELEKLASRISGKVRVSGFEHVRNPNGKTLTVSMGIVNVDMQHSEATILDIIQYADKTLYHAKDRGKNAVFSYRMLGDSEHEFKRILP